MQFLGLILSIVPTALALAVNAPTELVSDKAFNLTWGDDAETIVIYFSKDRNPPLYPIAVAQTDLGSVMAKMPKVNFDSGYLTVYARDGSGPIGGTGKIKVVQ